VKKANLWMVHQVNKGADKKDIQKMDWFESEKKALNFIKELKNNG
jgi:hypothetical protein